MNNTQNKQFENEVLQIPIEDIIPNRFQPRLVFDDKSLADLASSIKQHGIIQPLILRRIGDKYEIIAGERRYKAAKLAGLDSVPAVISNLDVNASAEAAIVENIQRKDLTAIEEAKSYQALLDKGYMTQEELARKMGLSQSSISNKLRLLTLDETVQEAVLNEKISERHARTLLKVPSHEEQKQLLDKIITERLTVRQLEEEIKNMGTEGSNIEQLNVSNNSAGNPNNANNIFDSPEKMPNKFFNFLEDTAANMNIEEPVNNNVTNNVEMDTLEPLNTSNNDQIEMLDDFGIDDTLVSNQTNNYYEEVLDQINNLHFDLNKVSISTNETLNEKQISISVKNN